jgi:conjugal transfer ATP-binding protein TraC
VLSTTAANIAPMQGEYLGSVHPHLLFVGRRGQPFFWSPFENEAGNHNVAICGKSGSGKSVLLQEMCAALRGAGAQVVVIDDGRSFEHSVKLQGGRFVEFTMKAGFCLNPFSMIDGERAPKTRITGSTASAWSRPLSARWRGTAQNSTIPSAA